MALAPIDPGPLESTGLDPVAPGPLPTGAPGLAAVKDAAFASTAALRSCWLRHAANRSHRCDHPYAAGAPTGEHRTGSCRSSEGNGNTPNTKYNNRAILDWCQQIPRRTFFESTKHRRQNSQTKQPQRQRCPQPASEPQRQWVETLRYAANLSKRSQPTVHGLRKCYLWLNC